MNMKPYRTNLRDVPCVGGLKRDEGWIDMEVRFLIDQKSTGSDKLLVGWTVLPPGARHGSPCSGSSRKPIVSRR